MGFDASQDQKDRQRETSYGGNPRDTDQEGDRRQRTGAGRNRRGGARLGSDLFAQLGGAGLRDWLMSRRRGGGGDDPGSSAEAARRRLLQLLASQGSPAMAATPGAGTGGLTGILRNSLLRSA